MRFLVGTLRGRSAVLVQCGIGKVNAGICAQTLINGFGVARVINTGVAGSLTSELSINDFVVSTDAVQHDFDVSPIGFARGEIPYTGLAAFPADEDLRAQAVAAVRNAAPCVEGARGPRVQRRPVHRDRGAASTRSPRTSAASAPRWRAPPSLRSAT